MGWRDVERDFYAGKISYAPKKKSAVDEGFGSLIRSIGAGMEGRFKQEQMMRLEEEADRKKKREEALAEQKAEEKKNAQRLKAAKSIVNGIGLDPNNTNFTNHVYAELEINGDDVNGTRNMYESLIKDGRLGKVAANSLYKNRGPKPPQIEAQMDEAFKESMSDLQGPREPKGVRRNLAITESRGSGDLTAKNVNPDGSIFAGRYQFGDDRLADYNAVAGTNYTAEGLLKMPEEEQEKIQEKIADWHFSDISKFIKSEGLDKFIGTEINGVTLTESSLVAVAHLGGKSGLKQFLLTDGKYNKKDSNGTSLTDYARTHAMAGGLEETSTAGDRTQETFIIEPPRPEGASTSEKLAIARLSPAERSSFAQSLDLQNPQQKALHDDIQAMNAVESPVDMDSWLSGIGSVGTTMAQITKAENSTNLSDDQRAKVLDALKTHLAKIQKDTDELNLTGETFVAPVSTDGGETFVRMSLQQRENGKYFAPQLNKTLDSVQIDMSSLQSSDEVDALGDDAVRLQSEVFAKMKSGRDAMTDLLRRAKSLDDLVATSDGAVLTTVGGRLPALLKRLEKEIGQLEPYFRDKSPQEVMGSFSKIVEQDYQEALQGDSTLANSEKAQLYSMYQSRVLELAYIYATAGLNQTRITDQDFDKALAIIQTGSDYPTFTKSIRSLVNQAYANNQSSHDGYLTQPTFKAAMMRPGADKVYNQFMIPFDDYLATQPEDIQASLEWMRAATPEINTGNPAQAIESKLNAFLNSNQFEEATSSLGLLNPIDKTPAGRQMFLKMYADKIGIGRENFMLLDRHFPKFD